MSVDRIELTVFGKEGGPLTKRIWLCEEDGSVKSDGSQCIMARGRARRVVLERMQDFGVLIDSFQSNEALATGALRDDLPPQVEVTTKRKLNGHRQPELITRTQEYIVYRSGTPSLVLLDFDRKGMPSAVANRLRGTRRFWRSRDLRDCAKESQAIYGPNGADRRARLCHTWVPHAKNTECTPRELADRLGNRRGQACADVMPPG